MFGGLFNSIREHRRKHAIAELVGQYTRILELETRQRHKTELFRRLESRLEQLEKGIVRAGRIQDKEQQLAELKGVIAAEKKVAEEIEKETREISRAERRQRSAAGTLRRTVR